MAYEGRKPEYKDHKYSPHDECKEEKYKDEDKYDKDEKCVKDEKGKKCENHIDLSTNISITQTNNNSGGDGGDGGDSGNAVGGAATAQSVSAKSTGDGNVDVSVTASTKTDVSDSDPFRDLAGADSETKDLDTDGGGINTTATGGAAVGGLGGAGGSGGAGGTASNAVSIEVNNTVVISCGYNGPDGPPPAYTVGMKDRKLDIKIDEEGNAFINGKKMESEPLEDGTKIFILRNSETQKAEDGVV